MVRGKLLKIRIYLFQKCPAFVESPIYLDYHVKMLSISTKMLSILLYTKKTRNVIQHANEDIICVFLKNSNTSFTLIY